MAPLMFRCVIVVGLVFLLRMSKSESAPLMPVRTEQRGGAAAVQEAEKDQQLVEAAAPAAAARQQRGIAAYLTGEVTDNDGGHKPKRQKKEPEQEQFLYGGDTPRRLLARASRSPGGPRSGRSGNVPNAGGQNAFPERSEWGGKSIPVTLARSSHPP